MGGQWAFPADTSRLQGGACGDDLEHWEFLADQGPFLARVPPPWAVQAAWNAAKREFCDACPIMQRCRERAMSEPLGIWGGLDQYERHKLRKTVAWKAARQAAPAKAPTAPAVLSVVPAQRVLSKASFPEADPDGRDGWTRDREIVRSAWYVSQSPDGSCIRMKLKLQGAGVIKWFLAEDVDLRRQVGRVIGRCPHHKHETEVAREESAEGVAGREVA